MRDAGFPYYVGGVIQERSELIVNTPENFSKLTGALVGDGRRSNGAGQRKPISKGGSDRHRRRDLLYI